MSEPAIRAEGLGKRYRLGRIVTRHDTLRDVIAGAARRLAARQRRPPAEEIWALADVSFEVAPGEVVGIVGKNGAGKSTLLKVLSRITEPTVGQATIRGRVGSLLEVGTGFHSELTGRENVYLNGAILGMRRREIDRKLDEIVAFAEVERFVDTPVKRYSSGMFLRLAFAVAAHLEPEILLVDEVLAVGDAAFQKKCLGKMGEVARQGRTVLFVSHNLVAIESLCTWAVWLEEGRIAGQGPAARVVADYLSAGSDTATERRWEEPASAPGNAKVRLRRAAVRPERGAGGDPIDVRTPFVIEIEYDNLVPGARVNLSLHLWNEQGIMVFNALPVEERAWQGRSLPAGRFRDVCRVPGDLMNDGSYSVELLVVHDSSNVVYRHPDLLAFEVHDAPDLRGDWYGRWPGAVRPVLDWKTELLAEEAHAPGR